MCFVHDYDWHASVCERTTNTAEKPTRCHECGRMIAADSPVHHVYMQQYEECRDCERGDCSCGDDCCQCPDPAVGETFNYDCCEDCQKFLYAVQVAEEEAGCSGDETRPWLGGMTEAIHDGGRDEARRYFKTALRMHPELRASGYLGWLWRWMFGH